MIAKCPCACFWWRARRMGQTPGNRNSIDAKCRLLAITRRQSHLPTMSGMVPTPDLPERMSGILLFSSGLLPGTDVADSSGIRRVVTHGGPFTSTSFSVGCLDNSSADQ